MKFDLLNSTPPKHSRVSGDEWRRLMEKESQARQQDLIADEVIAGSGELQREGRNIKVSLLPHIAEEDEADGRDGGDFPENFWDVVGFDLDNCQVQGGFLVISPCTKADYDALNFAFKFREYIGKSSTGYNQYKVFIDLAEAIRRGYPAPPDFDGEQMLLFPEIDVQSPTGELLPVVEGEDLSAGCEECLVCSRLGGGFCRIETSDFSLTISEERRDLIDHIVRPGKN